MNNNFGQLYRLYDRDGTLLYIGMSYSSLARIAQHQNDKAWWPNVARVEIETFPAISRTMLRLAEREAIILERPRHNLVHVNSTHPADENDWIAKWRNRHHPCPGCDKPAVWSFMIERFFHIDGSDNTDCWVAFLRREVHIAS